VEIDIGGDSLTARAVTSGYKDFVYPAGDSMGLIKNYANFAQLVVADEEGIVYAGEVWKEKDKNAVFKVRRINFNRTQLFLLLMGHWDKEGGAANPTLLASGFTTWIPNSSRKILVYMWPLQVEAQLPTKERNTGTEAPYIYGQGTVPVYSVGGCVMQWTLKTEGEGDPLAPLIAAQEIFTLAQEGGTIPKTPPQGVWADYSTTAPDNLLKVQKAVIQYENLNGKYAPIPITEDGVVSNVITGDVTAHTTYYDYAQGKNAKNWINFNLEYVPFNLTEPDKWKKWDDDSEFELGGGESGLPVWIIRNGINDEGQDDKTEFDNPGEGSNGNGAVFFEVKLAFLM
jgi:hypothetical protein